MIKFMNARKVIENIGKNKDAKSDLSLEGDYDSLKRRRLGGVMCNSSSLSSHPSSTCEACEARCLTIGRLAVFAMARVGETGCFFRLASANKSLGGQVGSGE